MSSNRQLILGSVGLMVMVGLMAWVFIWPGYREAWEFRGKVDELRAKIAGLADVHREVRVLGEQVDQAQQMVAVKYKAIPASPEVAELIRQLSLPVDGVSVLDQTFTAGASEKVESGVVSVEGSMRAMPLKVEMSATFESIYALLRAAESSEQLMRVTSLKVICKRDEKEQGLGMRDQALGSASRNSSVANPQTLIPKSLNEISPVLNASVGLEAIFDPPAGEEEGG